MSEVPLYSQEALSPLPSDLEHNTPVKTRFWPWLEPFSDESHQTILNIPSSRGSGTHMTFSCSQFKNNYVAEMCSGSEAGSYLRRIDFCITQL